MFRLTREQPSDGPEVEWLLDLAFAPGRGALSSYQLRQGVDPIADLCVVARDDYDVVAGCVRYWPVCIGARGDEALLLGPIAVHPTRQGEGLGALLMSETLECAAELGWSRVILIGDESYYSRFGFYCDRLSEVTFPKPYNPVRLLGRELIPNAFFGCSGEVRRWNSTRADSKPAK